MKKKFFSILACGLLAWPGARAQSAATSQQSIKPFSHLGLSLELFSTTGLGLELATPLSSHFALRGGISMLPASFQNTYEDISVDQTTMDKIDLAINTYNLAPYLASRGLPTRAADIDRNVYTKFTSGLVNGKLLADWYPWKNASFHLTGGFYFGSGNIVKVTAKMQQAVDVLDVLQAKAPGVDVSDWTYASSDEGWQLSATDIRNMNAAIKVNPVKPYIGLGVGRAVPTKHRVTANFELGALFWGSPRITSDNPNVQKFIDAKTNTNDGIKPGDITVLPVLSLKVNIRLF